MIHFDRWRDGLRYPLTLVREERRFIACVPPIAPFERVEQWTICARNEQEAHRTVAYHFGRTVVRYELGEPVRLPSKQVER
jgi:hypothetical protein